MEVKNLLLFHISHDKGAFLGGTHGITMAAPYLISASTPAFKLCPNWKQPVCIDAIWLPAQKNRNRLVQNNGYKQHFATETDENKHFYWCMDYYMHFMAEVWKSNPVRLLAPWVFWLACVVMSWKCTIVAFSVTYNPQCQRTYCLLRPPTNWLI